MSMIFLTAEVSDTPIGMVFSIILWTILLITLMLHSPKIWYSWFFDGTPSSERLQVIKQVLPFAALAFLGGVIGLIVARLLYVKSKDPEIMEIICISLGLIPAFLVSVFWYIWRSQKFLPLARKILLYIIHLTFVVSCLALILIKYFNQIF